MKAIGANYDTTLVETQTGSIHFWYKDEEYVVWFNISLWHGSQYEKLLKAHALMPNLIGLPTILGSLANFIHTWNIFGVLPGT